MADDIFLDATEHAQFRFDRHAARMRLVHDAPGDLGVLFEWFMAGVDHHRAVEAGRDAVVAGLLVTVVEMDRENRVGVHLLRGADHRLEIAFIGIFPRTPAELDDEGRLALDIALEQADGLFQIVDIVSADGVLTVGDLE